MWTEPVEVRVVERQGLVDEHRGPFLEERQGHLGVALEVVAQEQDGVHLAPEVREVLDDGGDARRGGESLRLGEVLGPGVRDADAVEAELRGRLLPEVVVDDAPLRVGEPGVGVAVDDAGERVGVAVAGGQSDDAQREAVLAPPVTVGDDAEAVVADHAHHVVHPPSRTTFWPVIHLLASLAR